MSALRVGVIGVGHLGYHHARNFSALPDVTLVGVVDTNQEQAAKAAVFCDGRTFPSIDAIIDAGVDAVSVAVPTTAHYPVVMKLLEAGIHVMVEKPIAASVKEAEEMNALASRKNRILQVGHIERFNGAVIALFESGVRPRFIECHRMSPYPMRGTDVSVVLDLMIHDLEIVQALDGGEVEQVSAIGVPVFSRTKDIANARIQFASGCVANITASRISMTKMRKLRVFGESAYVSTDYTEQEVLVYRKKPGPLPDGVSPMEAITIESLPVKKEEPLKRELQSFVACVREGKQPVVSGEQATRALRLAEQIIAKTHA